MNDIVHISNDGETPVNPYSLLEAVNRSSDTVHMAWLVFLAIMAYLMIAVAGVSHQDLLLERDVQLPILGVPIPLVQFFQFAPIFLMLFHLGLLAQLVLLARKTLEFDISVRQLEPTLRRTHPLRLELHNFFFVQGIAGSHRSIVMSLFLHSMSWMTLAILPVVLMLFIQLSFLPYHDVAITWTHRIALILDISVLGLIGVFLARVETNFFLAFWRASISYPITSILTLLVFSTVALFSLFVATVPGETLDKLGRQYITGQQEDLNDTQSLHAAYSFSLPMLWDSPDGSLFGFFHRRLMVSDADLVADSEVTPGQRSLSLRGRDLRFAELDRSDLRQADMTGANLNGASLVGANLRGIRLNCQNETELFLGEGREQANCASARGANFKNADLNGALLTGIDLSHAKLENAALEGTLLKFAILQGANFGNANLRKADLAAGVMAQGASFLVARLEGADFTGAQLQFADFSNAHLQGVLLTHAHLQGAVLRNADLSAASLRQARLDGADMTGAILLGVDMRSSSIWMTLPPQIDALQLADMSEVKIAPMDETERNTLEQTLRSINDDDLRIQVADSINDILFATPNAADWKNSDQMTRWQSLAASAVPQNNPDYRSDLTYFLERLACQPRWSDGAVAEGVIRRATERQFLGDLPTLYLRFTTDDECTPARAISSSLIQSLATTVNQRADVIAQ
ncbi:MAG: pentapeptide repeat-containing protein [Pseudomonadota bacterium]